MPHKHTLRELAAHSGADACRTSQRRRQLEVAARPFIELLVSVRATCARPSSGRWPTRVRNSLKTLNVVLEDTPDGTTWRYEAE
jgi:cysteinyl-tRNA synthetase